MWVIRKWLRYLSTQLLWCLGRFGGLLRNRKGLEKWSKFCWVAYISHYVQMHGIFLFEYVYSTLYWPIVYFAHQTTWSPICRQATGANDYDPWMQLYSCDNDQAAGDCEWHQTSTVLTANQYLTAGVHILKVYSCVHMLETHIARNSYTQTIPWLLITPAIRKVHK